MDQNVKWFYRTRAQAVMEALKKNRIQATLVEEAGQVADQVMAMIPDGVTVATGGSMTLVQAGLMDRLRAADINFIDRLQPGLSPAQSMELMRQGLSADVFLTGVNALTEQGELVYVDGYGNRAAGVLFGPPKVIIVTGCNKIVPNLAYAQERIRHFVAPTNAKRLNRKTPCAATGQCQDCDSPERICNYTVVVHKQDQADRMHVVLVADELGF